MIFDAIGTQLVPGVLALAINSRAVTGVEAPLGPGRGPWNGMTTCGDVSTPLVQKMYSILFI